MERRHDRYCNRPIRESFQNNDVYSSDPGSLLTAAVLQSDVSELLTRKQLATPILSEPREAIFMSMVSGQ
jgi:hypothetical protein